MSFPDILSSATFLVAEYLHTVQMFKKKKRDAGSYFIGSVFRNTVVIRKITVTRPVRKDTGVNLIEVTQLFRANGIHFADTKGYVVTLQSATRYP